MTLGKAERLGIQTACLPVKRYTQASRTVLNINHGKLAASLSLLPAFAPPQTSFRLTLTTYV
jgi:predicted acetyltransferase